MACNFCRGTNSDIVTRCIYAYYLVGRKLKCDGARPSCGNCNRRGYACSYTPVYVSVMSLNNL